MRNRFGHNTFTKNFQFRNRFFHGLQLIQDQNLQSTLSEDNDINVQDTYEDNMDFQYDNELNDSQSEKLSENENDNNDNDESEDEETNEETDEIVNDDDNDDEIESLSSEDEENHNHIIDEPLIKTKCHFIIVKMNLLHILRILQPRHCFVGCKNIKFLQAHMKILLK